MKTFHRAAIFILGMAWGCIVCEYLALGNATIVFRDLAGCIIFTLIAAWVRSNVRICPVCHDYIETYTIGKSKTYCSCP